MTSAAVMAVAPRGSMYDPSAVFYMEKLVTGPEAADVVDIRYPVSENIAQVAKAKGASPQDVTVVLLDRSRHERLVDDIRVTGARIKFITDGDVAGAIAAATPGTGVDVLLGIGGAPEAVVAATAIKALGGNMQCRLYPRNDAERAEAERHGADFNQVLSLDDLVHTDDVYFAATGITDGELLRGVHVLPNGVAATSSIVIRAP